MQKLTIFDKAHCKKLPSILVTTLTHKNINKSKNELELNADFLDFCYCVIKVYVKDI